MSKFLKGDRVRRSLDTGDWYSIKPGDVATVSKDQRDNVLELEGHSGVHFSAHKFELVHRPSTIIPSPFAIGDKVRRCDDAGTSQNCEPGGIYTVNCVNPDGRGGFDIGTTADIGPPAPNHYASNFDLVEKAPSRKLPTRAEISAPIKPEGVYNPNVGHAKDGGGLQQHSIGGPFPFVLVGIDNPTGLEPGLYWYVQDKAGNRCTIHMKSCARAGKVAAHLSTEYPSGINTTNRGETPPLWRSEGYIKPKSETVTVTLTRADAEAFGGPGQWGIPHNQRIAAAIEAAL